MTLICVCVLQVQELRSRQEAERKNQEVSHSQKMESLKQQYETSVQGVFRANTHLFTAQHFKQSKLRTFQEELFTFIYWMNTLLIYVKLLDANVFLYLFVHFRAKEDPADRPGESGENTEGNWNFSFCESCSCINIYSIPWSYGP